MDGANGQRGVRSVPGANLALAARLRWRTHRLLDGRRGAPVGARAVRVSTPGRYVFEGVDADGRPVFVKARKRPGALANEAAALRRLGASGLAAEVVDHVSSLVDVLVTARVPGEPPGADETAWRAAGAALRRLHAVDAGGRLPTTADAERWGAEHAGRLRELAESGARRGVIDAAAQRVAEGAARVLEDMDPPRLSFVHGDCMPKHVLVSADGSARFIDFDAAHVGDPLFDVAVLTTFEPQRLDAVLDGYGERCTPELRALTHAYHVLRLVTAVHWHLDHDVPLDPCIEALRDLALGQPAPR